MATAPTKMMSESMTALIDALTNDVRECDTQTRNYSSAVDAAWLRGMCYAFKCALGRALLAKTGIAPEDVDKANRWADRYLRSPSDGERAA